MPSEHYDVMSRLSDLSKAIKEEALRIGFSACGILPARPVDPRIRRHLEQWLAKGYQADMGYMENHTDKRCDPRLLVEGSRSIVSVALNYYPARKLADDQLQFAYYAYGKDYHEVMKQKLNSLLEYIDSALLPVKGRAFCDTAPVPERYCAQQAGLGWVGKNTQLIIPGAGSYFFLGELFLDVELAYDAPVSSRCGTCTRCLDACPTHALEAPRTLNAGKCLSYLTIEHRGEIPSQGAGCMGNRIYGCDECQRVCPWNRFARPNQVPELQPSDAFLSMRPEQWEQLTIEEYRQLFKGSAVKRAKYEGLMRNITARKNKD